jgi:hypothetical protein
MNTESTPPPLPGNANSGTPAATAEPKPVKINVLSLLKYPAATIGIAISRGETGRLTLAFTLTAVLCFAIFGFVLGTYSGGAQMWAVPLKLAGGGLFAALLCLPSLLIFGTMGGMEINFRRVLLILGGFLALTGLMFIGFAPIVWLFCVSTNTLGFMGFLALSVALISVLIGCNAMLKMAQVLGQRKFGVLVLWQTIFIFVMLQLTCTLRPLIGSYDGFLNFKEKRFFVTHWLNHGQ